MNHSRHRGLPGDGPRPRGDTLYRRPVGRSCRAKSIRRKSDARDLSERNGILVGVPFRPLCRVDFTDAFGPARSRDRNRLAICQRSMGTRLRHRGIAASVMPTNLHRQQHKDESEQRQEDGADGFAKELSSSHGQSLPSGNPGDTCRLDLFLRRHLHPGMDISLLARVGVLLDDLDFDDARDDLHSAP